MRWWSLLLFLALLAGPALAQQSPARKAAPDLSTILREVEKKYNRVKTVRMRFEQYYRQNQQVRKEEGTLYLRKPGQMRWEYEAPDAKLFLTDGKRLVLYVPAENRATEMPVKESDDLRMPLRFLLGNMDFGKEFSRIETVSNPQPLERGNLVMRAIPKRLAGLE